LTKPERFAIVKSTFGDMEVNVEECDVVVIGAGPSGSMLAAEVALAGHRVVVIEKRVETSPLSRAFGVQARTLEALDTRGLADDLIAGGTTAPMLSLWRGAELPLSSLPSRFPFLLVTPQAEVDGALERSARANGAEIVRGAEVVGIEESDDHIEVRAVTAEGIRTWRARYLVAADGAHSAVRASLGLPFPGKVLLRTIQLADARLTEPPRDVVNVNAVGSCFAFIAPFGDGWYRLILWDREHEADERLSFDAEAIRGVLRRAMGTDHGLGEIRWMSRFQSDERQLENYRSGRIFFVGDAAHVHSPAGAQGLNTGVQDALNLGWKLAADLDGAGPHVLESYHAERHPIGALVLRSSGAMIRMMTVGPKPARLIRNAVVRRVFSTKRIAGRIAGMFSGVGLRYPAPRGADRLVGTRAPDLALAEGRLFESLRGGGFRLVLEPGASVPDTGIRVVTRTDPGPALLVRPDGYVAWVGVSASGDWADVLKHWTTTSTTRTAQVRQSQR
jgi:2-polyprenyl-6-methoxyphenol hydroxylase-like FAD-dependent oxidoreductase